MGIKSKAQRVTRSLYRVLFPVRKLARPYLESAARRLLWGELDALQDGVAVRTEQRDALAKQLRSERRRASRLSRELVTASESLLSQSRRVRELEDNAARGREQVRRLTEDNQKLRSVQLPFANPPLESPSSGPPLPNGWTESAAAPELDSMTISAPLGFASLLAEALETHPLWEKVTLESITPIERLSGGKMVQSEDRIVLRTPRGSVAELEALLRELQKLIL